jgi:hypothetical protein
VLARHGAEAFQLVERKKYRLRRMKTAVTTNARLMEETFGRKAARRGRKNWWCAFVTLTYRPGVMWTPRHISETLAACRKWCDRLGIKCSYVWVAELQERGAVHYHVIFWMPRGYMLPKFDQRGWWPYGMTEVKAARNPVGYLANYAKKAKETEHEFPKGCRINGAGGLDVPGRIEARWWRAPKDAREMFGTIVNLKRATGGWFIQDPEHPFAGLFWRTPWRVIRINGHFHLTKANLDQQESIQ